MEIERRWKIAGFPENLPLLRQALFVSFYFRIESSSRASASCR